MPSPSPAPSPHTSALGAIIGRDPALSSLLARAVRVAATRMSVLVTGESGTGKELLARVLHEHGPTPTGPFVAVNCGALSRELAESELFGHERGAFTGAAGRRAGLFEEASGGTLVLDEVGELPSDLQPKLLRVLETGRLRRVGGSGEVAVDVRVVAMTLRDLRRDAARGAFRLDLYHRLAGFELELPPLRKRRGDIALLARHFVDDLAAEVGPCVLEADALEALRAHDWPGNVRELRNTIRRAAVLSGPRLDAASLELPGSGALASATATGAATAAAAARSTSTSSWGVGRAADGAARAADQDAGLPPPPDPDSLSLRGRPFRELEREIFSWALRRSGGSRRQAAAALGISRSTFCDRVKRLGVAQ